MPRNAVLVTQHILFQASLLKLHIPTFSSTNNVHTASHALSNSGEFINFDLFVATPNIVKSILEKQPSNSSPNEDGTTYHYLPSITTFGQPSSPRVCLKSMLYSKVLVSGQNQTHLQR